VTVPHLGPLDVRSPSPLPLAFGGLLQHLHLDLTNQPFTHVDPKLYQGSNDLDGAGLHSEAVQGVLDD
jgi:hypothetical protein